MPERRKESCYNLDEPADLDALADALRTWEPHLLFYRPLRNALLFEPDGTLYAVAMRDGMTFETDRRSVVVNLGDMIVLPRGHGVDAGDDVDLIAFCHDGPPPDHFRERFIQVWGFDHRPAPIPGLTSSVLHDVVPLREARLRVPYAVIDVSSAEENVVPASSDFLLLVALMGEVHVDVVLGQTATTVDLPARFAFLVHPGGHCRLSGSGRVGVLTVLNDLANEARVESSLQTGAGPEYVPASDHP